MVVADRRMQLGFVVAFYATPRQVIGLMKFSSAVFLTIILVKSSCFHNGDSR